MRSALYLRRRQLVALFYYSEYSQAHPAWDSSKDIKTLNDLFVHTLRDIFCAEQQIIKNLPDMIEKASDRSLDL
ncbi:hypothetical protein ACVW17_007135 [Bradyrhizobium sp. USDA 4473]